MGEEGISKRLDHYLLSNQLVNSLPRFRVWTHRCGISDHFSVILDWQDHRTDCAFPFKFNQSWLSNEEFKKMIRAEWPLILSDNPMDPMFDLSYKLRVLKDKVKSWTKLEARKMQYKSFLLEEEINSLLSSSVSALLTNDQQLRLISLKAELKKMLDHELYSARFQSRITWASNGDANTKFFHAVASAHKNHNAIWSLQDESGTWVSDDPSIKTLGTRHFRKIFEDDLLPPLLPNLKLSDYSPPLLILKRKRSL